MSKSRDLKKKVKEEFLADQEKRKARRQELAELPADQRRAEKRMDREQRKAARKERKLAVKAMPKEERKLAKKHEKYYRKLENRPRRYIVNTILILFLVFAVFSAAPFVGDFSDLMGLELTTDTPDAVTAREHGEEIAGMISDEGIVLLKNEENLLPLQDMKLNVFGF